MYIANIINKMNKSKDENVFFRIYYSSERS